MVGEAIAHVKTSHGICPWCAAKLHGVSEGVVNIAANHLGVPPGHLSVRYSGRTAAGKYVRIGFGNKTGWAGLVKGDAGSTVKGPLASFGTVFGGGDLPASPLSSSGMEV
jgi:hypothetical protein